MFQKLFRPKSDQKIWNVSKQVYNSRHTKKNFHIVERDHVFSVRPFRRQLFRCRTFSAQIISAPNLALWQFTYLGFGLGLWVSVSKKHRILASKRAAPKWSRRKVVDPHRNVEKSIHLPHFASFELWLLLRLTLRIWPRVLLSAHWRSYLWHIYDAPIRWPLTSQHLFLIGYFWSKNGGKIFKEILSKYLLSSISIYYLTVEYRIYRNKTLPS